MIIMQKIWRKNFEIQRSHPLLAYDALKVCYEYGTILLGRKFFTEIFWVNEGVDNTGTYFIKSELRKAAELTLKKIIQYPGLVKNNLKQCEKYNQQYFKFASQTKKLNLKKLTNRQLWQWY